jgi:hypothetical protein
MLYMHKLLKEVIAVWIHVLSQYELYYRDIINNMK